jgi:hypothetical protein
MRLLLFPVTDILSNNNGACGDCDFDPSAYAKVVYGFGGPWVYGVCMLYDYVGFGLWWC